MSRPQITFKGNPITVTGKEVNVGDSLPKFRLTGLDMADVNSQEFAGKVLVLSVVPSLDTPVCALQTKRFNQEANHLGSDVVILTASLDLPFAQKRWCGAEGIDRVTVASDYKYRTLGEALGVYLPDLGLLARSVFVVDKSGKVVHAQYVPEIGSEPDYDAVLDAVRGSL